MTAPVAGAAAGTVSGLTATEEGFRNSIMVVSQTIGDRVADFFIDQHEFLRAAANQAAMIEQLGATAATVVEGGQRNVAALTNGHVGKLFGVDKPPPVTSEVLSRTGISKGREYQRPLWQAVSAREAGMSEKAALDQMAKRTRRLVDTDMQLTKTKQSREIVRRSGHKTYRRIARAAACPLCAIASTQTYHSEDLLPMHPGCHCDIGPLESKSQLMRNFSPEKLAQADEQKKMLKQAAEEGHSAQWYRDKIAVREHGETGPTLTWKHQKFQGAEITAAIKPTPDLQMPTRAVKHYRAYEPDAADVDVEVLFKRAVATGRIDEPVTIRTDGTTGILEDGNKRLAAASRAGIKHVPVNVRIVKHAGTQAVPLESRVKKFAKGKPLSKRRSSATPKSPGRKKVPSRIAEKPTSPASSAKSASERAKARQDKRLKAVEARVQEGRRYAIRTERRRLAEVSPPPVPDKLDSFDGMSVDDIDDYLFSRHRIDFVADPKKARGARSIAAAIDDFATEYPGHGLTQVEIGRPKSRGAWGTTSSRMYSTESKIVINGSRTTNYKRTQREWDEHIRASAFVGTEGEDALYAITRHETMHVLDNSTGRALRNGGAADIKRRAQARDLGPGRHDLKQRVEWNKRNMSSAYGSGRYGEAELIAEALVDVQVNGKGAKPVSKAIHKQVMKARARGAGAAQHAASIRPANVVVPLETPKKVQAEAKKRARAARREAKRRRDDASKKFDQNYRKLQRQRATAARRAQKEAADQAEKRARKLQRDRATAARRAQRAADDRAVKVLKQQQAEADALSLAGDPPAHPTREQARKALASNAPVFTDKDHPPGPTAWVNRPSKKERRAALDARVPRMKENRLQRLSELSDKVKTEGRRWYPREGSSGRNTSIDAGLPPIYGSGANAAFSVRTDIKYNRLHQGQFFDMPADYRPKAVQTDFDPKAMSANMNRAKDVLEAPPTREGILAALQKHSPSPKLSNYFPALEGDRTAHTADTWDGRIGDHSTVEIRDVLGLPSGTRLTQAQEARGEKLLNIEEFGYHWSWNDNKGQWETTPNYTAADKINDNYDAFKRSNELAAAEAPPYHGRYESILDEGTGRYRAVLVDDSESTWDVRDLQAALWIGARGGGD